MAASVTPISSRLQGTKFGKAYPRFERPREFIPAEEVDPDAERFAPPLVPGQEVACAPPPKPRWTRAFELNAQEYVGLFNQLLIYRALRLLYGEPDIATALLARKERAFLPLDWSFTVELGAQALCEVRRKHFSRIHLVFWTPRLTTAAKRQALQQAAADFRAALGEFLQQNGHLWDEHTELAGAKPWTSIQNIAAEKYVSAERLLAAAPLHDQRPEARPIAPEERLEVRSVGYLYAAAALQFFVALEALVNVLYTLLLREEFRGGSYERLTVRSEIDLRLVSMHVFCSGFVKQPLEPGSDLWTRIIELRDLRNDLVHGNVTEEHRIYTFVEDGFQFFYSPSTDFRGRRLEAKARRRLPRAQTRITRKTVEAVKETVDQARDALIAAMDERTAAWVRSWINEAVIPPTPHDAVSPHA
jgi:hypothetical protein